MLVMDQQTEPQRFGLSADQTALWVGHHGSGQSAAHSTGQWHDLAGPIAREIFETATRRMIGTSKALCQRFAEMPNGRLQWVDPTLAVDWR